MFKKGNFLAYITRKSKDQCQRHHGSSQSFFLISSLCSVHRLHSEADFFCVLGKVAPDIPNVFIACDPRGIELFFPFIVDTHI